MLTIGSIAIFWNPNHKSYSKLHHRDIAINVQHVESSTGQTTSSANNLKRKTEQRNYTFKKILSTKRQALFGFIFKENNS